MGVQYASIIAFVKLISLSIIATDSSSTQRNIANIGTIVVS